eukprot:CAMPEP_0182439438 /NCGR_PEP_ID=MMETSP1167-20130531/86443_1 /TAXON_ID=2988 /ORGANISM="Mallomonas Sp, Strain CCMP3275" /LENGTH=323 /DNA_ID=CAMNT_0024633149 /DNA_START=156 /DNA_END=1124 /DNA_ORIENTATION=+
MCTNELIKRYSLSSLSSDQILNLCQQSASSGPAKCYVEGKQIGNDTLLIPLCRHASDISPIACYRRANLLLPQSGRELIDRVSLCHGASSDAPADCAASLPHWLTVAEKTSLCIHTPASRHLEPLKCLQAADGAARTLQQTPSRVLGVPLHTVTKTADRLSRALLISMCSFQFSKYPVASSDCLKSVPSHMIHNDAIRMCTNTTPNIVIGQRTGSETHLIGQCLAQLPIGWKSEEAAVLCEHVSSLSQLQQVIHCALESIGIPLRLTRKDSASICRFEIFSELFLQQDNKLKQKSNPHQKYGCTPGRKCGVTERQSLENGPVL